MGLQKFCAWKNKPKVSESIRSCCDLKTVLYTVTIVVIFFYVIAALLAPKPIVCPASLSPRPRFKATTIQNVVFGISANIEAWETRKNFIKSWWTPEMRGFAFLKELPVSSEEAGSLPRLMKSGTLSHFENNTAVKQMSAKDRELQFQNHRLSRVVSEIFRMKLPKVHWFVLGDDDTVFFPENLVRVLSKYDPAQLYYVGCISETHLQNVRALSTTLAFGGAGFAISYALAEELEKMQDDCLKRYLSTYSSDAAIHSCVMELGVSLTVEPGFHQLDIHGDASGLLGAHPLAPLVSLHHIDQVDPLYPKLDAVQSLKHLANAARLDSAALLQQSFCYSMDHRWSIKVSWAYAVQISRRLIAPRDLEVVQRSFVGWCDDKSEIGFSMKTLPVPGDPCERYEMFHMTDIAQAAEPGLSISTYHKAKGRSGCALEDPLAKLSWIKVTKEKHRDSWYEAPRRQCCRIIAHSGEVMSLHVSDCKPGEVSNAGWYN